MTTNDTRNRAWAEGEGLGKRLLKSMGWREGEGLGKHGQGRVANVKVERAVAEAGIGFGKDGDAGERAGDEASNGLSECRGARASSRARAFPTDARALPERVLQALRASEPDSAALERAEPVEEDAVGGGVEASGPGRDSAGGRGSAAAKRTRESAADGSGSGSGKGSGAGSGSGSGSGSDSDPSSSGGGSDPATRTQRDEDASRPRLVRYAKFKRAKDVTRYSKADLDAIFGRNS